ncbi:DUF3168 domain-containing protein [Nitratireductor alexandrii]|uniref:DUF3168 domain-containing protein n=1 Tax=Nitratireductor alexandrii TaxID=2448161 RepID=UPI001EE7D61D|nr:DUF3168 domain-containing protein [Nitratireductor alexandrii]
MHAPMNVCSTITPGGFEPRDAKGAQARPARTCIRREARVAAAAIELQAAVHAALSANAALTTRLGGPRIYDHAPANVPFPYVTFGRTSVYDWSTGTESGTEQLFSLHVWSKARGKAETLEIMDLIGPVLAAQPVPLAEGQLVLIRLDFAEVRYDDDLALYRGVLRFRALIEAAG